MSSIDEPSVQQKFNSTLKEIDQLRGPLAEFYLQSKSANPDSIFNQPGIEFLKYTNQKIKFQFVPNAIHKRYVLPRYKYRVKLIYKRFGRRFRWSPGHAQMPYRDRLYALFLKPVTDTNLIKTLWKAYYILTKIAAEDAEDTERKHQDFLRGKQVDLNSDDEIIFLSDDERLARKRKRTAIWQRLAWPPHIPPKYMRID